MNQMSGPAETGFELTGYHRVPRPMAVGRAPRSLRVLFLYSRPPLPMTRGDELTVAHLLEFLFRRGHEVDFLTLSPQGFGLRSEHKAWLESRCRRFEIFPIGKLSGLLRGGLGVLRGEPFQIGFMASPQQLSRARELALQEAYDLGYAYYIRSTPVLQAVAGQVGASFLALQLSQTLNTKRLSQTAHSFVERLFYRFESWRLAAYEARIWRDVDRCVLIGPKDLEAIRQVCREQGAPPLDNHVFGPHGVDIEQFAPADPSVVEPATVTMSGVMSYAPNVEAAVWFAKQVWPRIRAARPDARFTIVGRDPEPAVRALDGRDGVTVTGTVDDPALWIAKATVSVAPIRAAAGLQNKLLEAMATAKPVVATSVANEGIGAVADRDVMIADTPEQMAGAVIALLNDPSRRDALGRRARQFIEEMWTWAGPFLQLEQAFFDALDAKSR